jgi:hypothetical protein
MPEFGIIILFAFLAVTVGLALTLAYCSIVDGGASHPSNSE